MSQEHGVVITKDENAFDRLRVGSRVRVLANHSCLTAAQHSYYNVLKARTLWTSGRFIPAGKPRIVLSLSETIKVSVYVVIAHTFPLLFLHDMATAKDHIAEIIKRQPDDSSYDQIVRELAFDLMVQRGLRDSDERRTISNDEMQHRIKTWQK